MGLIKRMQVFLKNKIKLALFLQIITLVGIIYLYLGRVFNDFKIPYIEGDGIEYVLMTESFYNHFSPDLQKTDIESFKGSSLKFYHTWNGIPKAFMVDELLKLFSKSEKTLSMENHFGYFYAKNSKYYSYHFFTYSFFCLPAKLFCNGFGYPPLYAFSLTNALLIFIVCFLLLFYFTENKMVNIFAAICFAIGSNYWYLGWEHAEIFTTCFTAIGMILFFKKRYLLSIFTIAIAVSQTQTLLILLLVIGFLSWKENGFKLNYLWKPLTIGLIVILPPLFYYYLFNTTNIIKDTGFLNPMYMTANRLFGFYFDLNQGMILAMPFLLLTYLVLILKKVTTCIYKRQLDFELLFPIACVIITYIVSSMCHWSPGQSIVNRYTTWVGAIIFIHSFVLIARFKIQTVQVSILQYILIFQFIVCFWFQTRVLFDYEQLTYNPIAKFVLQKYPDYYNPDPVIFQTRTSNSYDFSPVYIYFDSDKNIKKVLVRKECMDSLTNYGMSERLKKRLSHYKDQYGWIYLKEKDHKLLKSSGDIYFNIYKPNRLKQFTERIKTDINWRKAVALRVQNGEKEEDVVSEIANYLFIEEEKLD
jgi:hypothetical protein